MKKLKGKMMAKLKQIESFVAVATRGTLSAAARAEGVTPAVMSRRLDTLEERLGVKLLQRSTRRLALTFEGQAFLEECQRILQELNLAEASVIAGGLHVRGHLRISAPAGFGRKHVAPWVSVFRAAHPELSVQLDLSDRLVDLVNEGIDCAIRLGELADSRLVSVRLAEMQRLVVASPDYLARMGAPKTPEELSQHNCLVLTPQRGWTFSESNGVRTMKVRGSLECNDGAVLHEWALAGEGLSWRSNWEVSEDLKAGRLCAVLSEFAAPPVGVFAVFPDRRHLPSRVRLFIDLLRREYEKLSNTWRGGELS